MPSPKSELTNLRPELATFMQLDTEMSRRGYVGTRLLPAFPVMKASGDFGVIKLASLLASKDADTKRTSKGGYNRGDYEFEERSFKTKEHGWEEPVDEREEALYEDYFDLEEIATVRAWEHVLAGLEERILNKVLADTVTAGYTAASGGVWTTPATATPIDDVFAAQEAVWARTGMWPRTVAMSRRNFRALRRTKQVKDEVASNGAGSSQAQKNITVEMLKEVLDVDEIIIGDAVKNTLNQAQSATIASSFPDDQIVVTRTATSNDFKEPCLGRLFHWGGDGSRIDGAGSMPGVVEDYEEPQTRKNIIRVRNETDEFILYGEMAQVVTGVR